MDEPVDRPLAQDPQRRSMRRIREGEEEDEDSEGHDRAWSDYVGQEEPIKEHKEYFHQ